MSWLAEYLSAETVFIDIPEENKEGMIDFLCKKAQELFHVDSSLLIKNRVLAREALVSTALGEGIAVPHCRDDSVDGLHVIFALSHRGIDWDPDTHQVAHFIFFVIGPNKENEKYLAILGEISRAGKRKECHEKLMQSSGRPEVLEIFNSLQCRKEKR